jgi:pimeloyl-ACP methyl ester carboxylesterase
MESARSSEFFTLACGRTLCYGVYGASNSTTTIFYHHGLPGSHVEALGYDAVAQKRNARVISIDRPGLGGSTYQAGRRLLDWPHDLLELADHLKIHQFTVLGVSGGGPYALACLFQLPRSRCIGGGMLASMYPLSLGMTGMMLQNRVLFNVAGWSTWLVSKALDLSMGNVARDVEHAEKLEQLFDYDFQSKPSPDRTAWENDEGGVRKILMASLREAVKNGSHGAAWEAYILSSDWGFDLKDLRGEDGNIIIWHGALDINSPAAMAEKAGDMIQGAEVRILESEGHFSTIVKMIEAVTDRLGEIKV